MSRALSRERKKTGFRVENRNWWKKIPNFLYTSSKARFEKFCLLYPVSTFHSVYFRINNRWRHLVAFYRNKMKNFCVKRKLKVRFHRRRFVFVRKKSWTKPFIFAAKRQHRNVWYAFFTREFSRKFRFYSNFNLIFHFVKPESYRVHSQKNSFSALESNLVKISKVHNTSDQKRITNVTRFWVLTNTIIWLDESKNSRWSLVIIFEQFVFLFSNEVFLFLSTSLSTWNVSLSWKPNADLVWRNL